MLDRLDFLPRKLLDQFHSFPLGYHISIHKDLLIQSPVVIDNPGDESTDISLISQAVGGIWITIVCWRKR
jgi:hypothetical protein